MKLLYSLLRVQPGLDLNGAVLAMDIAERFATNDPVKIDLEKWIANRKADCTTQLLTKRMALLKQIGLIDYSKSGKEYICTRGHSFSELYWNNSNAKLEITPKEKKAPAPKKPTYEERRFQFYKDARQYSDKYPKQVIADFCNWWTSEENGKMLFEKVPWNMGPRLATWARKHPVIQNSSGW